MASSPVDAARAILETNWTGGHTVPATGLYPHQWSWDSAFIAIGLRRLDPVRARTELGSLFAAQWSDGRLPQIVYDPSRDDDYAPGDAFWRSRELPEAGPLPSSGLIQPPNHAWAAWLVHEADPVGSEASGFLASAYSLLVRWHDYLAERRRSRRDRRLVVIRHPWEAGTDNSPLWDAALARIPASSTSIPRPDLDHAGLGERPGAREYAKYYWLAERYRAGGCRDGGDRPFALACPQFNALLAVSELALARMAEELGRDGSEHRRRGREIAEALDETLWHEELGIFTARDEVDDELVPRRTVNGLIPLLLPGISHAERLTDTLAGPAFLGSCRFVPSSDASAPEFDPALYWRGPAWFNTNWMLLRALWGAGCEDLAERLVPLFTEVAAEVGFPEYVDPRDGTPRGTRSFSWTAALAVDVIMERAAR
ncbi:MGH1-like glycoside hydrolase domain-containing protein [Agromyces archimandritae]|uniref:Mannosylglycerate hydrolase MGH1-like glycoside hydrolase domain-containing protein n=1 Tax=Agromyces archimandritae TaxID=2781962 RepID=A0A975FL64_9MICO|nr:hypothetical protein [Agromyces archimandritae]QTX03942.1 hypothetical protein G127AT_11580 [Agromyces archimandritae]